MSRLDAKYAKARDGLERAERDLLRAQNRWQKARELERRLGKQLEREPAPELAGGKFDWRNLTPEQMNRLALDSSGRPLFGDGGALNDPLP